MESEAPEALLAMTLLSESLLCDLQYDCRTRSCFSQRQIWQDQSRSKISCPATPIQSAWKHFWQLWQASFAPLPLRQTEHTSFMSLGTSPYSSFSSRKTQSLSLLQVTASILSLAAIVPKRSIAIVRAETSFDFNPAFWSSKTQRTCTNHTIKKR